MSYQVKEIFYTLQGEGANAGRAAVFCRFAGCNLWSGREEDRASAVCCFCDTDFVGTNGPGGGRFDSAEDLAEAVAAAWPSAGGVSIGGGWAGGGSAATPGHPLVVCTGGEPLLQMDALLIQAFHDYGFEVAVETNGTRPAVRGIDWLCVSPKAGAPLVLRSGHELKLVYPQAELDPAALEQLDFGRFYLQPMDGPGLAQNTASAVRYCMEHPRWRLSLQTHKLLGIP